MTYVPILPDIALIFDLLALIDTDEMAVLHHCVAKSDAWH